MDGILKGLKTILGDVEMAPYTVFADRGEYEERIYPAKKWVCSSRTSIDRDACQSALFRLLFNFISGKNEPNIRLDMTSPVTTHVQPGSTPTNESKFTLGFFIPEEHQSNPPTSDDATIFIEHRPELRVLTRRFGGYASDLVVAKEVAELKEVLKKAEEKNVNYDSYFIVGYDPPYKPINRRNEIWFIKECNKSPANSSETEAAGEEATLN